MIDVQLFKVSNGIIDNQCYLIHNNVEGVLVDPAWDYQLINSYIEDYKITLKGILITHGHIDHVHLAEEFSIKNNIPIWISRKDVIDFHLSLPNLQLITDQKKIKIGNIEIIPLLTPGHTLGSVCYVVDNHVFSGDTVFIEGVGVCSMANGEFLYNSVQFLKRVLPKDILFWPGHSYGESPGKPMSYLMHCNIYFQFDSKENFIAFRTRKNQPKLF